MRLAFASLLLLVRQSAAFFPPPPPHRLDISPEFLSEELLRARGVKEINLTLVGGYGGGWHPLLGVDMPLTERWLRDAMAAVSIEPLGWDATIAPHLLPQHVVRMTDADTGAEFLMVRLMGIDGSGWYPALDVRRDEPVRIGAPFWATSDNVSAVPSFANLTIARSIPRVSVVGGLLSQETPVAEMRQQPHTVQLVLDGADWELDAGKRGSPAFAALSRAFVGPADVGLVAGTSGWQLAASGLLVARRENASHLTLTVPPLPAYRIVSPETVTVTVPGDAILQHDDTLPDLATFVVSATPGTASLSGSLLFKNATTRMGPPVVARKDLEMVGLAVEIYHGQLVLVKHRQGQEYTLKAISKSQAVERSLQVRAVAATP